MKRCIRSVHAGLILALVMVLLLVQVIQVQADSPPETAYPGTEVAQVTYGTATVDDTWGCEVPIGFDFT